MIEPDVNQEMYGLPEYLGPLHAAWLNESSTLYPIEGTERISLTASPRGLVLGLTSEAYNEGQHLESHMLNYSIMQAEGILLLEPSAPLTKEDFGSLSADVDAYLSEHARLHGVMVRAKAFPGWQNFGGFTAHMHFVREHHKQVERVAVVTDNPLAGVAELLGKHFTSAEFKHFPFADDAKALEWLKAA